MRFSRKKDHILKLYREDPSLSVDEISFQADTSIHYINQVIKDYHAQLIMYYELYLAPSLHEENTVYLFNELGTEKKIKIDSGVAISYSELTPLEQLFISKNLGITEFVNYV